MKNLFVTLVSASTLVSTVLADAPAMRPLFNGKDLSGWKGDGYVVEGGAIVCTPKGRNLITEEVFCDYILDFEFLLTPGANNGLGIHYPGTGDAADTGMEIQILDSTHPKYKDLKDYPFHGGLCTLAAAKQGGLKPVGEWNRMMITLQGDLLSVSLNGRVVIDHASLPGVPAQGPIGFQHHGSPIGFANVWIKEL